MRHYYVYIMSSLSHTLYVGMTNNLQRRVYEHKHKLVQGFSSRYNITCLVYFNETGNVIEAIAGEKLIKDWNHSKKIALIESINPN